MSEPQYIIDEQQYRESIATHHLMQNLVLSERLLEPLGLSRFCWAILELRLEKVIGGVSGEIDIVAGPLLFADPTEFEAERLLAEPKLPVGAHPSLAEFFAAKAVADRHGILWPPPLEYLAGVEVKCAYNSDGIIKSGKMSRDKVKGIRKQLARDLDLGLNRVALLDIIAHQPTTSEGDGVAWMAAATQARSSVRTMGPILAARLADQLPDGNYLPDPTLIPVAHFVWSIGSVGGGDEIFRGAGAPILLRQAQRNPRIVDRSALQIGLHNILAGLPQPTCWPVLVKDCSTCNTIHSINGSCDH